MRPHSTIASMLMLLGAVLMGADTECAWRDASRWFVNTQYYRTVQRDERCVVCLRAAAAGTINFKCQVARSRDTCTLEISKCD